MGEGTAPTDQPSTSASTSQTKEEGGDKEKCGVIELVGGVYTVYHFSATHSFSSLVPRPRAPPGEKPSGERSRIPWAYYPKPVMTNEIARSVIIT